MNAKQRVKRLTDLLGVVRTVTGLGTEFTATNWRPFVKRWLPDVDVDEVLVDGSGQPMQLVTLLAAARLAQQGYGERLFAGDPAVTETMRNLTTWLQPMLWWADDRQVFTFDADLQAQLTTNAQLTRASAVPVDALRRLPFRHLFLAVEADPFTEDFYQRLAVANLAGVAERVAGVVGAGVGNVLTGFMVDVNDQAVLEDGRLVYRPDALLTITTLLDDGRWAPTFRVVLRLPDRPGASFAKCLTVDVDNVKDLRDDPLLGLDCAMIPLQLVLYLCAQNAELRPVHRPAFLKKRGRRHVEVQVTNACPPKDGVVHRSFTASSTASTNTEPGTGAPKRPHVRRAHWHHVWVGGRPGTPGARLELRWVTEVRVHADRTDGVTTVNAVE